MDAATRDRHIDRVLRDSAFEDRPADHELLIAALFAEHALWTLRADTYGISRPDLDGQIALYCHVPAGRG